MKVVKTIKLYIDGKFPRTESGRSYTQLIKNSNEVYARLCQASRKDFRNAIEVAKKAQGPWANKTAYNRGQILYRMAEMMEGKRQEFEKVLIDALKVETKKAQKIVTDAIDTFIYYAGFSDKYTQLLGNINPVATSHHNFTTPEAIGVVAHLDADEFNFVRLCSRLSSIVVSGNTVVTLLSEECPAILAPLSEVFATSDLPDGVINLLTGSRQELLEHVGSHKEVRSIVIDENDHELLSSLKSLGVDNMKRIAGPRKNILSLDMIVDCIDFKTSWHPIGV